MSKVKDVLRFLFISPEFMILLAIAGVYLTYPDPLSWVGAALKANSDALAYWPTIPIGLTVYAFSRGGKLLHPREAESNRDIYDWPDFWRLKSRVIASVVICSLASLLALFTWLAADQLSMAAIGIGAVLSMSIAATSTFLLYLAWLRMRELAET